MIDYKILTEYEEYKTQFIKRFQQGNTQSRSFDIHEQIREGKSELITRKLERERLQTPFVCYQFRVKKLRTFSKKNSVNYHSHLLSDDHNQMKKFTNQHTRNNSLHNMNQNINEIEIKVKNPEHDNLFRPIQERRQKTPLKMKLQQLEFGRNQQKLVDKLIEIDRNPRLFKDNILF